jgi:hypothetical protein
MKPYEEWNEWEIARRDSQAASVSENGGFSNLAGSDPEFFLI